jgi:hypothetical protein
MKTAGVIRMAMLAYAGGNIMCEPGDVDDGRELCCRYTWSHMAPVYERVNCAPCLGTLLVGLGMALLSFPEGTYAHDRP